MAFTDQDILAAIDAGPTGGATAGVQRGPIGITPQGEVELAERQAAPPRYVAGYEFFPGSRGPEWVARLQEALDSAGMYGKNRFARGVWDPEVDAKVFGSLLGVANANGWSWQEALVEMGRVNSQGKAVAGANRSSTGGITVQTTSPTDLRRVADRVARSAIGKKLAPEELDRFTQAYQSIEQTEAQQRIAASQADGSTIMSGAPSPEAFMEEQVERTMPGEVRAHKFVEKFNVFEQLLRGPGVGARPGEGGGTVGV